MNWKSVIIIVVSFLIGVFFQSFRDSNDSDALIQSITNSCDVAHYFTVNDVTYECIKDKAI